MRFGGWCVLLALVGCGDRGKLSFLDDDGDGFYDIEAQSLGDYGPYDCDDADPLAFPGGIEVCNGVDDDCSGGIDDGEDRQEFFADLDGDGFGNAEVSEFVCAAPRGLSA